jgi:hypothetical protein
MIFDSRVGGTEQILPENTSNPTTSPIIADIQYPDSLRSEQTFLYRESPTTVNGQAKITHIKGNTVVFNQLVQNGNFADTSGWGTVGLSIAVNNNKATLTISRIDDVLYRDNIAFSANHKGLLMIKTDDTTEFMARFYNSSWQQIIFSRMTKVGNIQYLLIEPTANIKIMYLYPNVASGTVILENVELFDLTQMGLDTLTVDQFTSLFSLPYYDYTQGKLLPFKGESLKTTGKNLVKLDQSKNTNTNSWNYSSNTDDNVTATRTATGGLFLASYVVYLEKGKTYYRFATDAVNISNIYIYEDRTWGVNIQSFPITQASFVYQGETGEVIIGLYVGNMAVGTEASFKGFMITEEVATDYEPYTSSTINLPVLEHFPTGMKSAGTVYDEITESKAITRVGSVDLGTLDWVYESSTNSMWAYLTDAKAPINDDTAFNCTTLAGKVISANQRTLITGKRIYMFSGNLKQLFLRDFGYTDVSTFKTAMSDVYLYYELATPTEEPIVTASLVTEKGETPLYYDDELIADCNETISSESGIFDAKIKLMTDETIYSQKIQLHVERKPQ